MANPASHEGGVDYPRTPEFDAVSETAGVSWACSLAGRFSMPVLLRNRRLADGAGSMQPVSASNIGDGGDASHSKAIAPFQAVTNQKHGVSALGLQRAWAQTAWAWLHKLRRAMVRSPGRRGRGGRLCGRPGNRRRGAIVRRPSRSSRLRKSEGGALAGSECVEDVAAMRSRLSKQPWRLRPSEPMAGQPTSGEPGYDHQPRSISAWRPGPHRHRVIAWPLA